jgi:hypothetical protein
MAMRVDDHVRYLSSRMVTEERFRELVDDRGIVRPGALTTPDRSSSYLVFAQRTDACHDMRAIKQNAQRFVAAKIGLTVEKKYRDDAPMSDAARVVLASDDGTIAGTRLCFGRAADASDLAVVEEAERAQGSTGMALLAQRCSTVWLIEAEGGEEDRVALALSAILASVLLGPIVPPKGDRVFGVRTARLELEKKPSPYR